MIQLDKAFIQQRFQAALESYHQHSQVQQLIVQQLMLLLNRHHRLSFERVLEVGCGSGDLTRQLVEQYQIQHLDVNDLCDVSSTLADILSLPNVQFIQGDVEHMAWTGHYDLIASASAVQWLNDLPAFIAKVQQHLQPQGYLLLSTFGEDNLREMKTLTDVGLHYPTLAQWQTWLAPHFELLHSSQQQVIRTFDTPQQVLQHLKYSGVTACHQSYRWTKQRLQSFYAQYQQQFSIEQGVQLTYHPILILARKK